jgi:hypothetical protein
MFLFLSLSRTSRIQLKNNVLGGSIQDKKYNSESSNLLDHIKTSYDFVWNNDPLEDNKDSVIYGELVVSPPPSGKMIYILYIMYIIYILL